MKVLITGGSGLIGTQLTKLFKASGHDVVHLSRNPGNKGSIIAYQWNVEEQFLDEKSLMDVDAIIHLAGVSVAERRWSNNQKKRIIESRVQSAKLIALGLEKTGCRPSVIVCASGIGYYGIDTEDKFMTESDPKGDGFLAEVVEQWENSSDVLKAYCDRFIKLRIGVVLSLFGGALPKMAQPIKLGVGAPLGKGRQYMSCIHIDDLCKMFSWAVENEKIMGTYNAVGPEPVTNLELTRMIAKATNRPLWLPSIPSILLKIMLGEMSTLVLGGNRVSCDKVMNEGFSFDYKTPHDALHQILKQ